MLVLLILVAIALVVVALHAAYRSFVCSQLEGLAADCAHIRTMVGTNEEALAYVALAGASYDAALSSFNSRRIRDCQAQMTAAYANLRSARRLVQPDTEEEDND